MTQPDETLERSPAGWVLLVVVLFVTGWLWSSSVRLPLSGEDYAIFHRLGQGESGAPHLFRPLPDWILRPFHAWFGVESSTPYHLLSIALHGINVALLFLFARRLFGSFWAAGLAAVCFGLGAVAADTLFWTAALNRLLSCMGLLLALNGLVRIEARGARAVALFALGFLLQFLSNAEVYGTGLLAGLWALFILMRGKERRAGSFVLVFTAGLLALHFLFLHRVPGGVGGIVERGSRGIWDSYVTRTEAIGAGLGLHNSFVLWAVIEGLFFALLALGGGRRACLVLGAWGATLVPFVLSDAVGYRFYPSAAPLALLVAGGLFSLQRRFLPRPKAAPALFLVGAVAIFLGSRGPRVSRLLAWELALAEVRAIAEPVRAMAEHDPQNPPVLVNLEASTSGLFVYHYDVALGELATLGFLDAASAYVDPGPDPGGVWYGRRCTGDFGIIEPELYLAQRPHIDPMRLYARGIQVATLDDARLRLRDPSVDLTREALLEAGDDVLEALHAGHDRAVGPESLEVLEPLLWNVAERSGTLRVRVRAQRPVVLALQPNDLFHGFYRFSPDQMLFSRVKEPRGARLRARLAADGEELSTFFVNAFGLGALVPAGDHEIELTAYVVSGAALR